MFAPPAIEIQGFHTNVDAQFVAVPEIVNEGLLGEVKSNLCFIQLLLDNSVLADSLGPDNTMAPSYHLVRNQMVSYNNLW